MDEDTNKNENKTEEESLTSRLDKLHNEYYRRFWDLEKNSDALPAPAVKFMQDVLYKQYVRDYELLMGKYGIDTDKIIEKLKIERDKEIEAIKLEHDELTENLQIERDKKIEAVKLEHERLTAGIEKQRTAQSNEIALNKAIAQAEHEMKLAEVVPNDLPKRWWQRTPRPNYAKVLSMQEVGIAIEDYYAQREQEIAALEGRPLEIETLIKTSIPCPKGRRARKQWERDVAIAAEEIERKIRCRTAAKEQLEEIVRRADEAAVAEAIEEPQETPEEEQKRKRKRKRKTQDEGEPQNEQLTGQVSMDELKDSGNEDKPRQGA